MKIPVGIEWQHIPPTCRCAHIQSWHRHFATRSGVDLIDGKCCYPDCDCPRWRKAMLRAALRHYRLLARITRRARKNES